MSKKLVIVESPTKAKTIEKFLGKDYHVLASYGHVRDLPNNAAEIPEEVKKQKWSRIGIDIENGFSPLYVIPDRKKKQVAELRKAMKGADELLLATDEDREGESISWHLLDVLKPKIPTKRLVFHEITKEAIKEALETTREIDENLVKAQETRRLVDRLFGYTLSPLLWKKMKPKLSAGRVQSVAIKLLVERERERISFRSATYWDLKALFSKQGSAQETDSFEAELTQLGGKRIAIGKDFVPTTGLLDSKADVVLLDEAKAKALKEKLLKAKASVSSIDEKPYTSRPAPPFTTSTLQQEGSRKLSFSARRTMQVAQLLYENGFITYMRTDSTTLSEEALNASRSLIAKDFGSEFLHPEPRIYKTKVRNAQEAHEAIRPAGAEFTPMQTVYTKFGAEAGKLYELIWKRTMASQMKDASGMRISVQINCEDAVFRAAGKTIEFAGFLRAYVEGSDDPDSDLADREKILPKMTVGETLDFKSLEESSHATLPPARFTEGSLIKELERLGIGRPSTWATIVDLVLSRDYAFKRGPALVPTFLAHAVIGLMEKYFTTLVDYEFTARLEDDLDAISRGEAEDKGYLQKFYFGNGHPGLSTLVKSGEETIDPREVCGVALGADTSGRHMEVRIGRWGPFISNGTDRAGLPDMQAPDELSLELAEKLLIDAAKGPQALGNDVTTGLPVYVKKGRFGPYIQLGEMKKDEEKPKMASLLPGMDPDSMDMETALKLLSLPRNLGVNPENKEDILSFNGKFGPYIKSGTETRSIPGDEGMNPINISYEQAIELLKQPKRRGRQTSTPKNLKELGAHPITQAALFVRSGRFGPYVTDGKINASLPRGMDPQSLTIPDAVNLLDARAAKIAADEAEGIEKKPKRGAKKSKAKAETEPSDTVKAEGDSVVEKPKKKSTKKPAGKKATKKKA
jgi:DNA topoisomerase-1